MTCALCGADIYNLALWRAIMWPHSWRCLDVRACAARQVRREQEGEGT